MGDSNLGGPDKNRARKHLKDKAKYKPKSVKDPKHVPQKSKPSLGSNWDRYEKEDANQTFQLTSSTDFSILANTPVVQGQHFQFKRDRVLAEEVDQTPHELFSLDLNMLKHSILTVPFYERVGISQNYFNKSQLSFMIRNAEDSLIRYNEKYNFKKSDKYEVEPCSISGEEVNATESNNVPDLTSNKTKNHEEISLVTKFEVPVEVESIESSGAKEDLEQWLDDILDE